MNAVDDYLISFSTLFLLSWIILLLVAYALAFRGEMLTTRDNKGGRNLHTCRISGLQVPRSVSTQALAPKLKLALIESHLLGTNAAQEPASIISVPEKIPY